MPERLLRVLLLEQSERDAALVTEELNGMSETVVVERIDTEEELEAALAAFAADVILADRSRGRREAVFPYSTVRALRPAAPVIMLANGLDEETFVTFMRDGPDDLVLKSNIGRLRPAITSAIEARKPLTRLSPRQVEVLMLVANGRSTREIADRFGLSVKTVESHRGAMMKRLGLHDIAALVRYAIRMSLVPSGKFDRVQ